MVIYLINYFFDCVYLTNEDACLLCFTNFGALNFYQKAKILIFHAEAVKLPLSHPLLSLHVSPSISHSSHLLPSCPQLLLLLILIAAIRGGLGGAAGCCGCCQRWVHACSVSGQALIPALSRDAARSIRHFSTLVFF